MGFERKSGAVTGFAQNAKPAPSRPDSAQARRYVHMKRPNLFLFLQVLLLLLVSPPMLFPQTLNLFRQDSKKRFSDTLLNPIKNLVPDQPSGLYIANVVIRNFSEDQNVFFGPEIEDKIGRFLNRIEKKRLIRNLGSGLLNRQIKWVVASNSGLLRTNKDDLDVFVFSFADIQQRTFDENHKYWVNRLNCYYNFSIPCWQIGWRNNCRNQELLGIKKGELSGISIGDLYFDYSDLVGLRVKLGFTLFVSDEFISRVAREKNKIRLKIEEFIKKQTYEEIKENYIDGFLGKELEVQFAEQFKIPKEKIKFVVHDLISYQST